MDWLITHYYYLSCHPTMCSMIFNIDHSELSQRKKTSATKGNPRTKSTSLLCQLSVCLLHLFAVLAPSFLLRSLLKSKAASKLDPIIVFQSWRNAGGIERQCRGSLAVRAPHAERGGGVCFRWEKRRVTKIITDSQQTSVDGWIMIVFQITKITGSVIYVL